MPELSPAVDLSRKETLFGLPERFVAAESALYLVAQFVKLKEMISRYLAGGNPEVDGEEQDVFGVYEQRTLEPLSSVILRRPVYYASALRSVNADAILQLMSKVAWDIKEVRSQHSHYVEVLLKVLRISLDVTPSHSCCSFKKGNSIVRRPHRRSSAQSAADNL